MGTCVVVQLRFSREDAIPLAVVFPEEARTTRVSGGTRTRALAISLGKARARVTRPCAVGRRAVRFRQRPSTTAKGRGYITGRDICVFARWVVADGVLAGGAVAVDILERFVRQGATCLARKSTDLDVNHAGRSVAKDCLPIQ